MTITIILGILIGALLTASALILISEWRRRHPLGPAWCGKCKYDLRAHMPHARSCPECGVGLTKRTICYKWEYNHPKRIIVAMCLGMIAIGMMGVVKPLGRGHLNAYKPIWLLRWEARHEREDYASRAAEQMCKRIMHRQLDVETVYDIVDEALAWQSDRSIEWKPWYGNIVQEAQASGYDDPQRWKRYLTQAVLVEVAAEPEACAGEVWSVDVVIRQSEDRFSQAWTTYPGMQGDSATVNLRQVRIGDQFLERTRGGFVIPESLSPGTYEATLTMYTQYTLGGVERDRINRVETAKVKVIDCDALESQDLGDDGP